MEFRRTKVEVLRTKKDWKDYAQELESLLLARPIPIEMGKVYYDSKFDQNKWEESYNKWWGAVADSWFVDEGEENEY